MRRGQFRSALGLEPNRPVILYAGKIFGRKRPEDLLAAYALFSPTDAPNLIHTSCTLEKVSRRPRLKPARSCSAGLRSNLWDLRIKPSYPLSSIFVTSL